MSKCHCGYELKGTEVPCNPACTYEYGTVVGHNTPLQVDPLRYVATREEREADAALAKIPAEGGAALRFNSGKPPLHLLAGEWQLEVARVMDYGAKKYAPNNWRKGGPWCEHLASVQRHILAFQNGEDKDPETGLSHLAHGICGLFFVLEWVLGDKGNDDRHDRNL